MNVKGEVAVRAADAAIKEAVKIAGPTMEANELVIGVLSLVYSSETISKDEISRDAKAILGALLVFLGKEKLDELVKEVGSNMAEPVAKLTDLN